MLRRYTTRNRRIFWLASVLFHLLLLSAAFWLKPPAVSFSHEPTLLTVTALATDGEFFPLREEPPKQDSLQALQDIKPEEKEPDPKILPETPQCFENKEHKDEAPAVCEQVSDNPQRGLAWGSQAAGASPGGDGTDFFACATVDWSRLRTIGRGARGGAGNGNGFGTASSGSGIASGSPNGTGEKPARHGISRAPVPEKVSGGVYPAAARRDLHEGVVLVKVKVRADGLVGEVQLAHSSGYEDLDFAALKAAKKWRFEPALRDGEAVATWLEVPVKYVLK
jgi:TonB family protein